MKLVIIPLLCFSLSSFSLVAFAQTDKLIVVPRKVVYKRTGTEVPEFKKTFEVRYPVIKSKLTPGIKRRIERETDYWRVFEMSLRENLDEDHWLSSFDYEIKYNKSHIFDIWLISQGVGAYPDSSTRYLVFDIRSGKQLTIPDLFSHSALPKLNGEIRKAMRRELQDNKDAKTAYEQQIEIYGEKYHPLPERLELHNLSGFSISDRGVSFIYDYGFPNVIKAIEPKGHFFFNWHDLKPYIKRGGLLARFIS